MTVPYGSLIKAPRVKAAKGRARPDEPLTAWCEMAEPDVCTGRAEVRHHRLLRKQGGTDDRENTMDLCDACHRHVHHHPEIAYARGWLLHTWSVR